MKPVRSSDVELLADFGHHYQPSIAPLGEERGNFLTAGMRLHARAMLKHAHQDLVNEFLAAGCAVDRSSPRGDRWPRSGLHDLMTILGGVFRRGVARVHDHRNRLQHEFVVDPMVVRDNHGTVKI